MQGNRDGLRYLERAVAMRPSHWWPHYALGHAYGVHGDAQRAVASFERALALRPGLADVLARLPALRSKPHVSAARRTVHGSGRRSPRTHLTIRSALSEQRSQPRDLTQIAVGEFRPLHARDRIAVEGSLGTARSFRRPYH